MNEVKNQRLHHVAALVATILVLVTTGCGTNAKNGDDVVRQGGRDAAGLTQAEVAGMSLEDEFGLASERYVKMQGLLEEAQLQISDGSWVWIGGDVLPVMGGANAYGEAPEGANEDNSYYVRTSRNVKLKGTTGERADLDPMIQYFDEKGWESGSMKIGRNFEARADTGDGWWVMYTVRPNGQYTVDVYSEVFWTNDSSELRLAIGKRDVTPFPRESVPGEYELFPSWSDPVQP
ncbi:hypothetical protein SOM11_06860 [Frigoribacterium sp. CFBP9039]|uniref:hypothetical protein n=1 Tax=Frigoribacterium TaxID=96492 RepID=UPI0017841E95|nr:MULTISPECIES: hypothetical protein [Frigoribacterium]MBD8704424.1 hypothetical protein [Frigoribacterium sp. CFBP 13712]MCJ0701438.1 hypothetical protein [Frigoribacterium faeni]MDY0891707.1 hypothetical protein [Frigoribacterium sp. CFBP9030]MDY0945705.1 hypothetical protein [Frigoribacterium sp. CFBP9039]